MSTANAVPETRHLEGDDALQTLRRTGWGHLARDGVERFHAADGFSHARALGYQFTLTALPGLIAAVGLATAMDRTGVRRILEGALLGLAPGPTGRILNQAFKQGSDAASSAAESALVIGFVAALVSGMFAMAQVERGANRIYGVERDRSPLDRYLRALLLACSAGLLVLLAFVLLVAGPAIAQAGREVGWSGALTSAWALARWPVGCVLVVVAFALLLQRAPRRHQPSASWLAVGAAVGVVLWILFTGLLALYLRASSSFGQTYGPLAGIIGLLLWSHLSALALFLGVAFSAQLEAIRAGVPQPQTDDERNEAAAPAPALTPAARRGP